MLKCYISIKVLFIHINNMLYINSIIIHTKNCSFNKQVRVLSLLYVTDLALTSACGSRSRTPFILSERPLYFP